MASNEKTKLEFMEKILAKMPSTTVNKIKTCEYHLTASSKVESNLRRIRDEAESDRISMSEKELEARIKLEELELNKFSKINKMLNDEISHFEQQAKHFGVTNAEKLQIEATIQNYNKLIKNTKVDEYIDVMKLIETHKEDESKRSRVKELEKYTQQFLGLPDNLAEAREAVRNLSEDVKSLRIKSELKTQQEVNQFNRTTSMYSSGYSFYHKK